MALGRTYLGIKFPFTSIGEEGFFVDMEFDMYKELKSDLIHLLFTPKGERYRNPDFGTNLLKYIFEPKDEITYTDIKLEIQEVVKKNIPSVNITDIKVVGSAEDSNAFDVTITYTINEGGYLTTDKISITL